MVPTYVSLLHSRFLIVQDKYLFILSPSGKDLSPSSTTRTELGQVSQTTTPTGLGGMSTLVSGRVEDQVHFETLKKSCFPE